MNYTIGKWVITLVALFTIISPYLADWNATHIYNPRWTSHAKFHNAQTVLLAVWLGGLALYFLWGRRGNKKAHIQLGALFAALYWLAQSMCILFPGTAFVDPEFAPMPTLGGVALNQTILSLFIIALLSAACWFESRRLSQSTQNQ